ncbi:MAG: non-heme iron oxygenase ferredoxin subunit [Chloroflexota bacterium]
MATWSAVARVDDVAPGMAQVVAVGKKRIALCNVDGDFFAVDDLCTHDDGPLGEGELVGDRIECPRHGALFDVRTGQAMSLPAVVPVSTYPVRVKDGSVEVEIE